MCQQPSVSCAFQWGQFCPSSDLHKGTLPFPVAYATWQSLWLSLSDIEDPEDSANFCSQKISATHIQYYLLIGDTMVLKLLFGPRLLSTGIYGKWMMVLCHLTVSQALLRVWVYLCFPVVCKSCLREKKEWQFNSSGQDRAAVLAQYKAEGETFVGQG